MFKTALGAHPMTRSPWRTAVRTDLSGRWRMATGAGGAELRPGVATAAARQRLKQPPSEMRIPAARAEVAGIGLQARFGLLRRNSADLHDARDRRRHEGNGKRGA